MRLRSKLASTQIKVAAVALLATMALASTNAWSHFVSLDGEVDVEGDGYWKTGDGKSINSSSGCVLSGKHSDDNSIGTCIGEEGDAVAEAPKEEAPAEETKEPVAKVETLTVNGVGLFDTDSDQLTAEGRARISALLAQLEEFKGILGMEVAGHTDDRGSDEYNQGLSERRAATVQALLAAAYPDVPINSVGFGESSPVASNSTDAGMAQNRRVEVSVDVSKMTFE